MAYQTNVYVDAFNLYYGCTKKTPYRWLNLAKLAEVMLRNNVINRIKVFTGIVKARPNDPQQPLRQQIYLRALRTLPNLEIIEGSFLSGPRSYPLLKRDKNGHLEPQVLANGKLKCVDVLRTEEKGSDVNLAVHLLYDAFIDDFEVAVVISNDSDLAEPVRIVTQLMKKKVGILNPQINRPEYRRGDGTINYKKVKFSHRLCRFATFKKPLTEEALMQCQFDPMLRDEQGMIYKPSTW